MEFLSVLIPALGSSSIDPVVISPARLQEVEISPLQCHWLCLDFVFFLLSSERLWLFSCLFDTLSLPGKSEVILKPRRIDTRTKQRSGRISQTSFEAQFDNRINAQQYKLLTDFLDLSANLPSNQEARSVSRKGSRKATSMLAHFAERSDLPTVKL